MSYVVGFSSLHQCIGCCPVGQEGSHLVLWVLCHSPCNLWGTVDWPHVGSVSRGDPSFWMEGERWTVASYLSQYSCISYFLVSVLFSCAALSWMSAWEYDFLIQRDEMMWPPFFQEPGVACVPSAFEMNWGHGFLWIILFIIQQWAFPIQLFSFSISEDQFICAEKNPDKVMEALNLPAGIESALAFGFWVCVCVLAQIDCWLLLAGCPPDVHTLRSASFSLLPAASTALPRCMVGLAVCTQCLGFLEALGVSYLLMIEHCSSTEIWRVLYFPTFPWEEVFTFWYGWLHRLPKPPVLGDLCLHLALDTFLCGVMGVLPKPPTKAGSFCEKCAKPSVHSCEDQCVRLQIPWRIAEVIE